MTLFDDLRSKGEETIKAMVEARSAEAVDLEFKRKSRAGVSAFEKDDKQNLGRTLSAFANSAGGTLIFGIEAKRGADGVDCATALHPITNIAAFASEASTLSGQYLFPRYDGIRLFPIECADGSGAGYLVIQVDRSERRPHQSKAPDDGRYYKRAGDSTFAMEHYDIEDAFRRTSAPLLMLSYRLRRAGSYPGTNSRVFEVYAHLKFSVDGGVARSPFLHLPHVHPGRALHDVEGTRHGLRLLPSSIVDGEFRYDGGSNDVYQDGITYEAGLILVEVHAPSGGAPQIAGLDSAATHYRIDFRLGAEGCRTLRGALDIPVAEIIEVSGAAAMYPQG